VPVSRSPSPSKSTQMVSAIGTGVPAADSPIVTASIEEA
jgi:hypothetical protein